jgi:hypothetical protein
MQKFDNKLNLLIAYPYFSPPMLEMLTSRFNPENYRLIVDSGAFSVYNAGERIELEDYCKFIRWVESRVSLEAYIQLDVVFNEIETLKNYNLMIERGFKPAPVFTRGADENYFHELLERDEYVFVGGVQTGINSEAFAKWVLENSKDKRVHLLAFIRPDLINHFKPFSVDASSWSCTSRFGRIGHYEKGRMVLTPKDEFRRSPPKNFLRAAEALGIDRNTILKLRFDESWTSFGATEFGGDPNVPVKGLAQFITIMNFIYYTILAQNKIGTKIYLAVGQPLHLSIFAAAYKHLKDKGLI